MVAGQGGAGSWPRFDTMIQITRQQETFSHFPLNSWTAHPQPSVTSVLTERGAPLCWLLIQRQESATPSQSQSTLCLLTSCPWLMVCLVFELVISGIFNELVKINPPRLFVICILLLRILSKLQSLIDDKLMSGWFLTDDTCRKHPCCTFLSKTFRSSKPKQNHQSLLSMPKI